MAQFYTESNLVGNILIPLTSTTSTITATFIDRITGLARAPQTTTNLFVIDKGTATNPNPNWELIYTPDAVTTTAGVTTLTNVVRGIGYYGTAITAVTANQKAHIANAEIGVADTHLLWNALTEGLANVINGTTQLLLHVYATEAARDIAIPTPTAGTICIVTGTKTLYAYINGSWYGSFIPTYADAAARDAAITVPVNGMKIYNTADGVFQGYVAGSWTNEGTSTTPNMSLTVAGKGEEASAAEIIANTQAGGTGAELIVNPKYLSDASVTTTAGAADAGKYIRANASGLADQTLLASATITPQQILITGTAGETLVAGNFIYKKSSDSKIYKASNDTTANADSWNVLGVITTGGAANAAIVYQPLVGEWTTSGLTAGATYYLSTAGNITSTRPSTSSSTVVPIIVGVAKDTTTLSFKYERIQRRKYFYQAAPLGTNLTITVGFPISHVVGSFMQYTGAVAPNQYVQLVSQYDVLGGSQSVYIYSGYFAITYAGATIVASVNGSNNLVLTGTFGTSDVLSLFAFEAL